MTKDIDLDALQALPEPYEYCYVWDEPYGKRKFSPASHNGRACDRTVPLYTGDQIKECIAPLIARIRELEGDAGKSAEAWISVGELAKFLSDIDSPAERPDALAKLICDWLPSRAGERKSDGVVESKANSLGGFVGGFIGLHGRKPTEQEIWNAAVQSGMRRVKAARSATFMPPKEGWQYEYSPSTKYVQASHPKGGKQSICEVTIPFDSDAIGYAIAAALAGRAAPEGDERCRYCDGTGHVHDITGEWRGQCPDGCVAPEGGQP